MGPAPAACPGLSAKSLLHPLQPLCTPWLGSRMRTSSTDPRARGVHANNPCLLFFIRVKQAESSKHPVLEEISGQGL